MAYPATGSNSIENRSGSDFGSAVVVVAYFLPVLVSRTVTLDEMTELSQPVYGRPLKVTHPNPPGGRAAALTSSHRLQEPQAGRGGDSLLQLDEVNHYC
jgi:hypothetical protein